MKSYITFVSIPFYQHPCYVFTPPASILILFSLLIFTPACVYWVACASKKYSPHFSEISFFPSVCSFSLCALEMNWGLGWFIRTQVRNFNRSYSTHIRQFPFPFSALLGKVRTGPSLVTWEMLMEWKSTVVYRVKKTTLKFITSHDIYSIMCVIFLRCLVKSREVKMLKESSGKRVGYIY
jgi:hypothetical protein